MASINSVIISPIFNYSEKFDMQSYISVYANEFKFSPVKVLNVNEDENYVHWRALPITLFRFFPLNENILMQTFPT